MKHKHRPLWIAAVALVALPLVFTSIGLTYDAATVVVILALAAMGLNLLVGYTGLVSFGHSAWFGIGGYAAALAQLHWFRDQMLMPFLFAIVFTAVLSLAVGFVILRRRGVYFSLLTLALCALTFAISFRWTSLTGGEGGLGGIERFSFGPFDLNQHATYYAMTALVAWLVVFLLLRIVRSPFGHVLVAIRENQQRATFQGYDIDRYKLLAFVLSAALAGLAGSLKTLVMGFATLSDVHWSMSGEVILMSLLGGVGTLFGPVLGAGIVISLQNLLADKVGSFVTVIIGAIFVVCVMTFRKGVVGELQDYLGRRMKRA